MVRNRLGVEMENRSLPAMLAPSDPSSWQVCRAALLDALASGVYGRMPPAPAGLSWAEGKRTEGICDGKGTRTEYHITVPTPGGRFTFPFQLELPTGPAPVPVFIHLSFHAETPDPSCPAQMLLSRGYGVASLAYGAIAPDRADGLDELLPGLFGASERDESGSGTIGYWSWAAQRVMDCLAVLPGVDSSRIAVIGHSRLGKTALWCGATDERFNLVISVQSGCSGAAVTRGKVGERVAHITGNFPHWFCPRYATYASREAAMPFDQHFLLAAIAPRLLYVCSAQDDQWADPDSEYLGCAAASPAWERLGKTGFVAPDLFPSQDAFFADGCVGYHLRPGGHALQPDDWARMMDFWDRHR